jgi:HEPN domain-containing protein
VVVLNEKEGVAGRGFLKHPFSCGGIIETERVMPGYSWRVSSMPERSADWLKQAKRDYEVAEAMMRDGFYEWACFAAQQSAEKALKAVFQKMHALTLGHSLGEFLKILGQKVTVDEEMKDCARALDRYYIPSRYPNGFSEGSPMEYFTEKEAHHALFCARRILGFCEGILVGKG